MESENKHQKRAKLNHQPQGPGMKAQRVDGAALPATVKAQQAADRQIPGAPAASANLDPGLGGGGGKGWAGCGDQRETGGNRPGTVCSLSKDNSILSVVSVNTQRARFKNTMSSELVGLLYSIPHTHQACPQFLIALY